MYGTFAELATVFDFIDQVGGLMKAKSLLAFVEGMLGQSVSWSTTVIVESKEGK